MSHRYATYPMFLGRLSVMLLFGIALNQTASSQSIELDKQLGAENAVLVEQQMGLYTNAELTTYVAAIGNRLVSALEEPRFTFRFQVVDDPIPNAFALPGGYIYVTRGILSLIVTEDELACVMAHEIIHVTRRHSIRQLRKSILPRLLEVPGKVVGRVISNDLGKLINAPIQTSNLLLQSSYSRKFEKESDIKGITLAGKAGYDASAMSPILDRIAKAVEIVTQQTETRGYFDDHPYTPDRIRYINKQAATLPDQGAPNIAPEFPAPLDGMTLGLNPDKGMFRENVFLHAGLDFTITFPKDWETTNQTNAVGAIHEDRQAGLFVGLVDPDVAPANHGKAFEEKIKNDLGEIVRSQSYRLNQNDGYLLSILDDSGGKEMYIHILWTKLGELTFQLIGFGPKTYAPALKRSAESFRRLSKTERKSIKRRFVDVVEAKENETIGQLTKRIANIVHGEYVPFLNRLDDQAVLTKGQRLKVIREEQAYR